MFSYNILCWENSEAIVEVKIDMGQYTYVFRMIHTDKMATSTDLNLEDEYVSIHVLEDVIEVIPTYDRLDIGVLTLPKSTSIESYKKLRDDIRNDIVAKLEKCRV